MPISILMPALSPTMTEGNLAKWLKKEGDKIKAGDVIAEIETDKATMEVESADEGILVKIIIQEGTNDVKVNEVIGILLEEGEDASSIADFVANLGSTTQVSAANSTSVTKSEEKVAPSVVASKQETNDKVKASPLAKRIADEKGVNLSTISGTGPHGRIIKADVLEAGSSTACSSSKTAASTFNGRNPVETTMLPVSNMRKVIAKRLLESKQTVPHFYLTIDCELDKLLAVRQEMNAAAGEAAAYKLSVNDFVIKATALALRDVPEANCSWGDNGIIQYNNIDVSVAVAIDGGLITPIVKNADQKSISTISNEMKDLAKRARENKLAPAEFQGGSFSISNLGMYGIKQFNAIINPPQSCILAVGVGQEKVVVRSGQMVVRNIVEITLSSDHRVVDGAVGANFLSALKKYIESPVLMFV